MYHRLVLLLASLALTACSSIPITSLPKLAGLSPETMDFADIELAVRVQDDFNVRQDSAVFAVTITNEDAGELLNETLILEDDPRELTRVLKGKLKPGFQIIRYRVGADTAAEASDIRARVLALKQENPDGNRGSFSASANICRQPNGNPLKVPMMTIFVRLDPDADFFTLIKETRLPLDMSAEADGVLCKQDL